MARLERDGVIYVVTDEVQLAAFRAAGWEEAKEEKPKRQAVKKPQAESKN